MKLILDTDARTLTVDGPAGPETFDLYSDQAFEAISRQWLRVGWNQKYSYSFTWLGRPVIQLPEDLIRIQEAVHRVAPDVLIETGVAHGGSLIFYASLFEAMGRGQVIGVDIEIRSANRAAIESHPLAHRITLIEDSSVADATLAQVRARLRPTDTVMVVLDSCHTRDHVRRELELYAPLVTPGSYIVAMDGIMRDLHDVPRGAPGWVDDHPPAAVASFAAAHPEFAAEAPAWAFNESTLRQAITYAPDAWLRRRG